MSRDHSLGFILEFEAGALKTTDYTLTQEEFTAHANHHLAWHRSLVGLSSEQSVPTHERSLFFRKS
jgi:hypothetical protein